MDELLSWQCEPTTSHTNINWKHVDTETLFMQFQAKMRILLVNIFSRVRANGFSIMWSHLGNYRTLCNLRFRREVINFVSLKYACNIWMGIEWGQRMENLDWPLSMHFRLKPKVQWWIVLPRKSHPSMPQFLYNLGHLISQFWQNF